MGTYVRMRVLAQTEAAGARALAAARAAIVACEARFSLYRSDSELCRLNALEPLNAMTVSPEMFSLLSLCDGIARGSDYLFDLTVGGALVAQGLRPGTARAGHWQDVVLDRSKQSVHFTRPLTLDLGGIAKGFAVDCAVEAALNEGATGVLIDAGGDMRASGALAHPLRVPVRVRDPRNAQRSLPLMHLENAALATSGGSAAVRTALDGEQQVPTLDPRRASCSHSCRQSVAARFANESVSVTAARCAVADALTKVVQLSGNAQHPLLARFNAQAIRIDATDAQHYVIETTRAAA